MSHNCDSQVLFAQNNHDDGDGELKEEKEPGNKCLQNPSMVFIDCNLTDFLTSDKLTSPDLASCCINLGRVTEDQNIILSISKDIIHFLIVEA